MPLAIFSEIKDDAAERFFVLQVCCESCCVFTHPHLDHRLPYKTYVYIVWIFGKGVC